MAKEIYKKILEVQKGVLGLAKDTQGNAATYLSGNKLLSVVRPLMDKQGLLLLPEVVEAKFTPNEYQVKTGTKKEFFCELKMRFTWVDVENCDYFTQEWASTGQTGFDKSIGSALTYGERYYLMKVFHIQTDKDDVDAPKSIEEEMNLQQIIDQINTFTTSEQMTWAWQTYEYYQKDRAFKTAFAKRQQEIANGTAK